MAKTSSAALRHHRSLDERVPLDGEGPNRHTGCQRFRKDAVRCANGKRWQRRVCSDASQHRHPTIPDQIPNWILQTATNELHNRTTQRRNSKWKLVQDIDALFGKLWSSHAVEGMRVYGDVLKGVQLKDLPRPFSRERKEPWRIVFPKPGRHDGMIG
jgi:hypothetical protein